MSKQVQFTVPPTNIPKQHTTTTTTTATTNPIVVSISSDSDDFTEGKKNAAVVMTTPSIGEQHNKGQVKIDVDAEKKSNISSTKKTSSRTSPSLVRPPPQLPSQKVTMIANKLHQPQPLPTKITLSSNTRQVPPMRKLNSTATTNIIYFYATVFLTNHSSNKATKPVTKAPIIETPVKKKTTSQWQSSASGGSIPQDVKSNKKIKPNSAIRIVQHPHKNKKDIRMEQYSNIMNNINKNNTNTDGINDAPPPDDYFDKPVIHITNVVPKRQPIGSKGKAAKKLQPTKPSFLYSEITTLAPPSSVAVNVVTGPPPPPPPTTSVIKFVRHQSVTMAPPFHLKKHEPKPAMIEHHKFLHEVIVKGLRFNVDEGEIVKFFEEKFGEVIKVDLIKGEEGSSKGMAFIGFKTAEACDKAVQGSSCEFMRRFLVIEKIKVQKAGSRADYLHSQQQHQMQSDFESKTVYLRNLSQLTDQQTLRDFFSCCGTVVKATIAQKDGVSRGFGHVEFQNAISVRVALNKSGQLLNGRPIRVDIANVNKHKYEHPLRNNNSSAASHGNSNTYNVFSNLNQNSGNQNVVDQSKINNQP